MYIVEENYKDISGREKHKYFRYKSESKARKAMDRMQDSNEDAICRIYKDITYAEQTTLLDVELPF